MTQDKPGYFEDEQKTMTWIEVVDSAVKIGLGGLIGGLFSYINTRGAYKNEVRKEYVRFKRESLIQVASDCTLLHNKVINIREWFANEKFDSVSLAKEIYALEANLIMVDEPDTLKAFKQYCGVVADVINNRSHLKKDMLKLAAWQLNIRTLTRSLAVKNSATSSGS